MGQPSHEIGVQTGMTTLLILAALGIWAAGLTLILALCRSAAHGDNWRDDRSLELATQQFPRPRPRQRFVRRGDRLGHLERL